jgi:hypothetical protein
MIDVATDTEPWPATQRLVVAIARPSSMQSAWLESLFRVNLPTQGLVRVNTGAHLLRRKAGIRGIARRFEAKALARQLR